MEIGNDIFEKIGKPSMGVPEGYFDGLKSRLESIPSAKVSKPGIWAGMRPYLALAASFAAIVLIGNAVLRDTVKSQPADPFYGEDSYADIISIQPRDPLQRIRIRHGGTLGRGHHQLSD